MLSWSESIIIVCRCKKALKGDVKKKMAIVGKYAELEDSYLSITEAIKLAARGIGCKMAMKWLEAEDLVYKLV